MAGRDEDDERDGAAIGRSAGSVLADVLLAIQGGARTRGPIGVSRKGNALARVTFANPADAGAWLQTPGLVDAFVVDVSDDEVRIALPSAAATSFDLVWRVRYVCDDGGVATSLPAFMVAPGMDELLDDFNDGVAAGLELHPRTAELRDGFGALGEYDE